MRGGRSEKEVTRRRNWGISFLWAEFPNFLKVKHLLSLEKLPGADMDKILRDGAVCKRERARRD